MYVSTPTATVCNMAITMTPVASTDKIYYKGEVRPLTAPVILFTGDVAHVSRYPLYGGRGARFDLCRF